MVKLIGVMLIVVSLIASLLGIFIDLNYGSNIQLTGSVISNIVNQPDVDVGFSGYAEATLFSVSVITMIMGVIFLFRV